MNKKPKKWNERDIDIIFNNLVREYGYDEVHSLLRYYFNYITDNMCDAKNLVYYSLKRRYSKINMSNYGTLMEIEYEPKPLVPLYSTNLVSQPTYQYSYSSVAYQYYNNSAPYYQII